MMPAEPCGRSAVGARETEDEPMEHISFWWEFVGKVGAPIFAATLVVSLLSGEWVPLHGVLMMVGFGMMAASHWQTHHRDRSSPAA